MRAYFVSQYLIARLVFTVGLRLWWFFSRPTSRAFQARPQLSPSGPPLCVTEGFATWAQAVTLTGRNERLAAGPTKITLDRD